MSTRTRTTAPAAVRATAEGTSRYAARHAARFADDFYRPLKGGLVVSSLGLGSYLGECDDADDERYEAATAAALRAGINLLDTAINYRCQRSERSLGRALGRLVEAGDVARDEVVVCTKAGYIPLDGAKPASREAYQAYLAREYFDAGVMTPDAVVANGHCLAPGFLAHQLAQSRANLGLDAIDVFYLHNPEQQLEALDAATFRARLAEAFAFLEERAEAGEIGAYGCATWGGLRTPPGTRGHLSLPELVGIAREVGGTSHRFRVVQLPINLALAEAVRAPTQRTGGRMVPLLQAAADLGVAVVASATLLQAQLTSGLPDAVRDAFPALETDAQRAIAFVRTLPNVTAALVGMRSAEHVTENLGAARA